MTEVDDIQSFIAAQKKRIQEERAGLNQPSFSPGNVPLVNYDKDFKLHRSNDTNAPRQEQLKAKDVTSSPTGLQLGAYEYVQEKLRKERAEEYKKYLAEKSYRTTGRKSFREKPVEEPPVKSALKHGSPRATYRKTKPSSSNDQVPEAPFRPQKTLEELYDAYEELMERKRQEERRYRSATAIDDPYLDPARHVRFGEDVQYKPQKESWLENGSRRRWDVPDKDLNRAGRYSKTDDNRTFEYYQDRPRDELSQDRMSRSAPPTAVPLFGEKDMSPEVKQQRQSKYRQELEAQMKEREMQKRREKKQRFMAENPGKEDEGLNAMINGGESTLSKHQPSFQTTVQPRHEQAYNSTLNNYQSMYSTNNQPYNVPQDRYQPSFANQTYQSTLPQGCLPFNQLDQRGYSYLNQPLNYPSSLLPTGPAMSGLNLSGGLLAEQLPSLRSEPLGGYQPSWAGGTTGLGQRTSGLPTSLGSTGGLLDSQAASLVNASNPGFNSNFSNAGFSGALPLGEASKEKDRSRQESYRDELAEQMREKEARKKKEREDGARYDLKLERELEEHSPWGKAGGGAPLRDHTGKLVSDLRTMHQYNKEGTIISPRDRPTDTSLLRENGRPSAEMRTGEVSPSEVDQFQPSPVRTVKNDSAQKNSQQEYKEYLKQQVEEKQRKKKEEDDRLREMEERQDKIILEQQKKLKDEYEKEMEAARQKEEAARQKNEELRKAAEEKKKEVERKRLEEDRKQEEKLKKDLEERLKAAKAKQNARCSQSPPAPSGQTGVRSSSPPIPTLQKKAQEAQRPASPPIPTLQNKQRPVSPAISQNEATETRTHASSSKPRRSSATADIDVLSQLTSLRRQLKKEEVKVQQQLSENKEKYVKLRENSEARRNKKPVGNVFDNVFRKPPSSSQRYDDVQSSEAINEFNKMKYGENSSLHGDFLAHYPEPATSPSTLDLQQKSLLEEQQKRLKKYQKATSDKENFQSLGNNARPPSITSQLESDSQFVPVNDGAQVPQIENQSPRMRSARERRRWKQLEDLSKATKLSDYKPRTPGGFSVNSVTSFNVDELAQKNEDRLRKLEAMKQARAESKGDPNEVLKRFIQRHSRPDSKLS